MKVSEVLPKLSSLPNYIPYIEVIRPSEEIGPEGELITRIERFDITGFTEAEIQELVDNLKVIYPDALRFQAHFCGHIVKKRCYVYELEV